MLLTLDDNANNVDVQRISSYWMRTHNARPLVYANPWTRRADASRAWIRTN